MEPGGGEEPYKDPMCTADTSKLLLFSDADSFKIDVKSEHDALQPVLINVCEEACAVLLLLHSNGASSLSSGSAKSVMAFLRLFSLIPVSVCPKRPSRYKKKVGVARTSNLIINFCKGTSHIITSGMCRNSIRPW